MRRWPRSPEERSTPPVSARQAIDPYPGHWKPEAVPSPFPETPEGSVLGSELVAVARRELEGLPERQRTVVALRDNAGFRLGRGLRPLDMSVANQRVLLHRGRAVLRAALENYLQEAS